MNWDDDLTKVQQKGNKETGVKLHTPKHVALHNYIWCYNNKKDVDNYIKVN